MAANAAGEMPTIAVFPIAPPRDLCGNSKRILKAIVAAIEPRLPSFTAPDYDFTIDPVCGWIRYALRTDLWNASPKSALPKDERAATEAAQSFITRLAGQCRTPEYLALGIPPLLPTDAPASIVPVSAAPVMHPDHPWPDHFLCRFEVLIASALNKAGVSVVGGGIDIRIGHRSKVVGMVSHWRPAWLEKEKAIPADFYALAPTDSPPPPIVYLLAGEKSPQSFLAPYHYAVSGDDGDILPASSHSFTVSMAFAEKKEGGVYVLPVILGSSQSYTLSWACWRPDALFDEGLVSFPGHPEFIELSPGVHNVMLHVEENTTGAVALCERMVYVRSTEVAPAPGADVSVTASA